MKTCGVELTIPEGFAWKCDRDAGHPGPHMCECDWCDGTGREEHGDICGSCVGMGHPKRDGVPSDSTGAIVWRDGDRLVRDDFDACLVWVQPRAARAA